MSYQCPISCSGPQLFSVHDIIANPGEVLRFFLYAYAQPLLDHAYLRLLCGTSWWVVSCIMGWFVCLFTGWSVYGYIKYRQKMSALPFMMIIFSLLCLLGIFCIRFSEYGGEVVLSDRYYRLFQLSFMGAIWIYYARMRISYFKLGHMIESVMGIIIVMIFLTSSLGRWISLPTVINKKQTIESTFVMYANNPFIDIGRWDGACMDGRCEDTVHFLKKNRLSFFK